MNHPWNPFGADDWSNEDQLRWEEYAERVSADLVPKITGSALTISLAPPNGEADVKFAVELGMSIMLSKPIVVVVDPDGIVPPGLERVAHAVIRGDMDAEETRVALGVAVENVLKEVGGGA